MKNIRFVVRQETVRVTKEWKGWDNMSKLIKDGRTLYVRDPDKNYAFVKVGEIAYVRSYGKAIYFEGKLYTLTQEIKPN